MKKPLFLSKRSILITAAVIFIILNSISLFQKISQMSAVRKRIPYLFMGYKFSGLSDILKDSTYVSYYTDKDMHERQNALQFAQAQYVLAPIILDRALLSHEYILLDCSSDKTALKKIEELGVLPVKRNQFGIILARNPKYKAENQ